VQGTISFTRDQIALEGVHGTVNGGTLEAGGSMKRPGQGQPTGALTAAIADPRPDECGFAECPVLETKLFSFNVGDGEHISVNVGNIPPSDERFLAAWRLLDGTGTPVDGNCGEFSPSLSNVECGPLPAAGNPYQLEIGAAGEAVTGNARVLLNLLTSTCATMSPAATSVTMSIVGSRVFAPSKEIVPRVTLKVLPRMSNVPRTTSSDPRIWGAALVPVTASLPRHSLSRPRPRTKTRPRMGRRYSRSFLDGPRISRLDRPTNRTNSPLSSSTTTIPICSRFSPLSIP
jgi:hypothetical protein